MKPEFDSLLIMQHQGGNRAEIFTLLQTQTKGVVNISINLKSKLSIFQEMNQCSKEYLLRRKPEDEILMPMIAPSKEPREPN